MKKDKKLIIVADDFGLASGVNLGILALWEKGVLGGASLAANAPCFLEAVSLAQERRIEIGFHLNLTQGKPILPAKKVKSLVDQDGFFLEKERLFLKTLLGLVDPKEIAQEIEAQIETIKNSGLRLVFANGHQNVHLFPGNFKIFLEQVSRAKINFIRPLFDAGMSQLSDLALKPQRKILLFLLGKLALRQANGYNIKFPKAGFSLTLKKEFDLSRLFNFLDSLAGETLEMAIHPGYSEKMPFVFKTYLREQRQEELEFLLSPNLKREIKTRGYKLIHFSDLR